MVDAQRSSYVRNCDFSADMTVAPPFFAGIGAGLAQNGGTRVITRFKKHQAV
jgi:hypothetical protein